MQEKIMFNRLVNRMIGKSPFWIMYGILPRVVVYLADLPDGKRVSVDVESMLEMLKKTHEEVK